MQKRNLGSTIHGERESVRKDRSALGKRAGCALVLLVVCVETEPIICRYFTTFWGGLP